MRDTYADLWLGFNPDLLTEWLRAANFEVKEIIEQETHSYFKIIAIKATKKGGTSCPQQQLKQKILRLKIYLSLTGREEIILAEKEMPGLMAIRKEYGAKTISQSKNRWFFTHDNSNSSIN